MILDQLYALSDIPKVFTLGFLELLLSADNALVLGVLSHSLPKPLRRKALFIGVLSAFFLRALALFGIGYLFESIWVQLLGGAYLVYLPIRYFSKGKKERKELEKNTSFWKVVVLIELLDIAFAVDSIVAGLAFIDAVYSKIWIVYVGGMLGLIGMRFAADMFSSLITKFPKLEQSAYFMVGWIGLKLSASAFSWYIPPIIFWTVIFFLFLAGFFRKK